MENRLRRSLPRIVLALAVAVATTGMGVLQGTAIGRIRFATRSHAVRMARCPKDGGRAAGEGLQLPEDATGHSLHSRAVRCIRSFGRGFRVRVVCSASPNVALGARLSASANGASRRSVVEASVMSASAFVPRHGLPVTCLRKIAVVLPHNGLRMLYSCTSDSAGRGFGPRATEKVSRKSIPQQWRSVTSSFDCEASEEDQGHRVKSAQSWLRPNILSPIVSPFLTGASQIEYLHSGDIFFLFLLLVNESTDFSPEHLSNLASECARRPKDDALQIESRSQKPSLAGECSSAYSDVATCKSGKWTRVQGSKAASGLAESSLTRHAGGLPARGCASVKFCTVQYSPVQSSPVLSCPVPYSNMEDGMGINSSWDSRQQESPGSRVHSPDSERTSSRHS
ncbi:hypothetical protein AXG93_1130s1500 [Marchantia polymorpha subsp. ruderalis]|uniref:Uncharacterized protein n=1 Tax=Marchantia polymorpha subsp. ruderalis TaxID=1480154 RepID=A0A176VH50_MARPO|nr:hypothetical protein AXG93_1130s1500 [Marchantia polymorpha subsp. ruderalis]